MRWTVAVRRLAFGVAVTFFVFRPLSASAAATVSAAVPVAVAPLAHDKSKPDYLLSTTEPYTPRDTEYSVEGGAMAERRSLYWVAANIGQHLGKCVLTASETCQQYLDGIVGVGGRDAETYGVFLASLRWQFVNFPRSWSPLLRVFAGPMRVKTSDEDEWRTAYGAGLGVITFLHEKVDLRFEARVGQTDHMFAQAMIAVHFKADKMLEYFGEKLQEIFPNRK